MRSNVRKVLRTVALVSVLLTAVAAFAQYNMTVNKDRLINAGNEPQNWLMMNGDYGATRYSKLSQINRDNVRNLRMVWAMALGGMQDVGQNGPENEVNPLIDNGFMYTTDGWGTVYKISPTGVFTPGVVEFNGPHGANPQGSLVEDLAGNIVGATYQGGVFARQPA